MRFSSFGLGLLSLALASPAPAQTGAAAPDFTPESFRSHVTFLADDRLEGRDSGSRGYDLAALYVASRFEALGLRPAGQGGWYQQVPFLEYRLSGEPASLAIGGRRFAHGQEVVLTPTPQGTPVSIDAPVVFVGYGLAAPELGIDDYKGLDVRGKVVAVLNGFPKGMKSDVGAHLNSEKRRVASERGAVGLVSIRTPSEAKRRPWSRLQEYANEPAMTWTGGDGQPYTPAPGLRFRATLDTAAAEALFAGAKTPLRRVLDQAERKGGRPKGFALKPRLAVSQQSSQRRFTSPNVLAILPGSDPKLAGEYVLLMAHLDHEGVKPEGEGDRIYNGAMDNAVGIATMLEVARALAQSPERPRRSILFAAVTAEEDGLLGAQYLARHPVPGGRVAAVVNLDMPVLLYDFTDVIAFGAEHSTMGAAVARAGRGMGVALSEDPLPEEGLFTRSDHYRFVQEGVPSVFLMTGFANGGREKFTHFLATHYHKVSDDLSLPIDWKAGAKFARINYEIAREIADAPQAPRWYEDSFFGKILAPDREKAPSPR
ncbi:MAG TPA: M28 family metallopeptidase [Allosphingosinicella sp.]|nr:M28 family metallopeptidase [Allosphingosinicella sp.]